jgi:hypothetical protein
MPHGTTQPSIPIYAWSKKLGQVVLAAKFVSYGQTVLFQGRGQLKFVRSYKKRFRRILETFVVAATRASQASRQAQATSTFRGPWP